MHLFRCLVTVLIVGLLSVFPITAHPTEPPTRVALERVIIYDFEHLPLGPVGEGGPIQGQPHELSWAAVGQVDVIDGSIDGNSLLITHPASGSPTAWFQLPGNVGLTSGQVRFSFQVRPSARDEFRILFRRPGSSQDGYLTIRLSLSGNVVAQSGLLTSVTFGTYNAGDLLEFTVDFDLDQMSWSAWFNGTQQAEDRPINPDVVEGLGRIGFSIFNTSEEGRTLEFDNVEILRNAPAVTLLDANFNDKTIGEPIGTGGAELGEPVAVSDLLETWIGTASTGGQALYLMKEDPAAFSNGYTEWRFLSDASVQTGWLDARFDMLLDDFSNNDFILAGAEDELIRVSSTVSGDLQVRFGDEAAVEVVGSYEIGDSVHARLVCQMDERFCSVALDGEWVISKRAFAEGTPTDLAVDRFHAGIAGVSVSFALVGMDNLHISATAPSVFPVSAEFIQQPTDTVCREHFDPPLTVMVRDGNGDPVVGEWTLLLSEYTSVLGWNPLDIDEDPVTVDGLAEFTEVTLRRTAENVRLQALVAGHSPAVIAVSEPFDGLPGPLVNADYEGEYDAGPFFAGLPQSLYVAVYDDCFNDAPIGTEGTVVIHSGPEGASLSGNIGTVTNEWGEIELLEFVFDLPGEYVLDLEIDGVRLESLSDPIMVIGDRIFGDRFQSQSD